MKNNDIINVTTSENSSKLRSRKILSVIGVVLLVATFGATAGISVPDIDAGQNGFKINSGTLDVGNGDITSGDGGTTIWDQSNGYIPATSVDQNTIQSGTTASDVGLGSVRNVDLSNAAGNDITYDTNNENFDVDSSTIQSGTTASDVGLGNVQNEAQLSETGDTLSGNLRVSGSTDSIIFEENNSQFSAHIQGPSGGDNNIWLGRESFGDQMALHSSEGIVLRRTDGSTTCSMDSDGSWNCDGSKNWVHDLENGSEAFYSSQESPEVRAVFEGQTTVTDSKKVELPGHFSNTVSDTEPKMRAQVTPQGTFTKAVVMDKTDDYIEIKVGKETKVDYRVTGIREGYEDKQVVREKE